MQNIGMSDIQTTLILTKVNAKLKWDFPSYFSVLEMVFFQKMGDCIFFLYL
jgi:hypothetical protein